MVSLSTYWFFGLDGSVDKSCNKTCTYVYIAKVTDVILPSRHGYACSTWDLLFNIVLSDRTVSTLSDRHNVATTSFAPLNTSILLLTTFTLHVEISESAWNLWFVALPNSDFHSTKEVIILLLPGSYIYTTWVFQLLYCQTKPVLIICRRVMQSTRLLKHFQKYVTERFQIVVSMRLMQFKQFKRKQNSFSIASADRNLCL